MSEAIRQALRVVAYQADGSWIAHCVDYDIAAQGDTLDEAMVRFDAVMEAENAYTQGFQGIEKAPDYIEALFASTFSSLTGNMDVRIAA